MQEKRHNGESFNLSSDRGKEGYDTRKTALHYACNPVDKHRLTYPQWYTVNKELNRIFELGIDDKTLLLLSKIDHKLGEVDRFSDNDFLPPLRSDNTAAHSKQVMNLTDYIFYKTGQHSIDKTYLEQMRKDAVTAAMIHDMGEIIVEGTTLAHLHRATEEQKKEWVEIKERVEPKIFAFVLMLLDNEQQKFPSTSRDNEYKKAIIAMRSIVHDDEEKNHAAVESYPKIEKWIDDNAAIILRGYKPSESVEKLIALYDMVEHYGKDGDKKYQTEKFARSLAPELKHVEIENPNLIGAVVKTLERVEGYKYFKKNISENPDIQQQGNNEFLDTIRRNEKSVHEIFKSAEKGNREKNILAVETAKLTYATIASALIDDNVGNKKLIPDIICLDKSKFKGRIPDDIAENQISTLDKPATYINRKMLGCIYRAAAFCLDKDVTENNPFIPQRESLIDAYIGGELPKNLIKKAKEEYKSLRGIQSVSPSIAI